MDTVAKLPLGQTTSQGTGNVTQLISKVGTVRKLLDENFGLIQIPEGLALFDTCDFWITATNSAASYGKKLNEVVSLVLT